jgi:hypothetical protein
MAHLPSSISLEPPYFRRIKKIKMKNKNPTFKKEEYMETKIIFSKNHKDRSIVLPPQWHPRGGTSIDHCCPTEIFESSKTDKKIATFESNTSELADERRNILIYKPGF